MRIVLLRTGSNPADIIFRISVEAEYAGYYMVGNTKISGTGNKPYHCQRSAAQKALEYIENKVSMQKSKGIRQWPIF